MTKPRSDKKLEPRAAADPKILPMDLRVGDRLADETGEWEVIERPYTTNAGKDARVRVRKIGQPDVTEIRISWTVPRVAGGKTTAGPFVSVLGTATLKPGKFDVKSWIDAPGVIPQEVTLEKK